MLVALAVLACGLVAPATLATTPAYAQDLVDAWRPGDVHVHAAGDSGLRSHVRCQSKPSDIDCANFLVRETQRRARANGIDWLIYTEHIPWLGIHPEDKRICVPTLACMSVTLPRNDPDQAQQQYTELRNATAGLSTVSGVRGLMGQELGTAGQITVPLAWALLLADADYDEIVEVIGIKQVDRIREFLTPDVPDVLPFDEQVQGAVDAPGKAIVETFVHGIAAGLRLGLNEAVGPIPCLDLAVKSGHFAVYAQNGPIPDNVYACDEDTYLADVAAAGAWGGVNHPDNADGGSRWYCWSAGDDRPVDLTGSRRDGSVLGPRCRSGVAQNESSVRTVEIVNDHNMPTTRALREIDGLLLRGNRIGLVGGGDAHTARPDGEATSGSIRLGPIEVPVPNLGLGRQEPGNEGKIGLSGRTWLPLSDTSVPGSFDPADPRDPVRLAIAEGRTVASTGPLGLPRLGDSFPGDTARVGSDRPVVRVDFRPARVVAGTGEVGAWDPDGSLQPVDSRSIGAGDPFAGVPERIVVVAGRSNSCSEDADARCVTDPDNIVRTVYRITDTDRARNWAEIPVDLPPGLSAGYLRTETLYGPLSEGGDRFDDGLLWQNGAFSSPIWLLADPTSLPATALGEDCGQAPIPSPVGVDSPVSCVWNVEADLDGNGRPDRLVVWRRTGGTAVLDPDIDNGAIAHLDDGTYHFWEEAQARPQPAQTFVPVSVIDSNDDGRQEVAVRTDVGANTDHYILLTVTPDQRLHTVGVLGGGALDLSAGGGAGSASGFGCATSEGRRLLASVGFVSDPSVQPYGYAYEWEAAFFRVEGATATQVAQYSGYRADGDRAPLGVSLGANGCTGSLPELGPF